MHTRQSHLDQFDQLIRLSQILHLADSALPIGGTPHSYGLEGLVLDGIVTATNLNAYLLSYLQETGHVEARCCSIAYRIGLRGVLPTTWPRINRLLSAMQPAREMRDASTMLGRRFLLLALRVTHDPTLEEAVHSVPAPHHATAFGLVGGCLGLGQFETVTAFLHSLAYSILAAGQRLLLLGEMSIVEQLWSVKPLIASLAQHSRAAVSTFTPSTDIGSMRHAYQHQRLFIS